MSTPLDCKSITGKNCAFIISEWSNHGNNGVLLSKCSYTLDGFILHLNVQHRPLHSCSLFLPKTCLAIQRDSTVWRKEFWVGNETSLLVCLTNNLCYFQSVSSQRLCLNLRWKEGYDLDDPVPPLIPNDDSAGQFGKLKNDHLWVYFFKLMQQALLPGRNHRLRKAGFVQTFTLHNLRNTHLAPVKLHLLKSFLKLHSGCGFLPSVSILTTFPWTIKLVFQTRSKELRTMS